VQPQGARELRSYATQRVERPERILRHEPDPPASKRLGPVRVGIDDGIALERDRAAQDSATGSEESRDGKTEGRLPAARFTHESDDLARRDIQIGATDDVPIRGTDPQVADPKYRSVG